MLSVKQQRCRNNRLHIYYLRNSLPAKSGGAKKSTCSMHNVWRILSGHQELSLFLCSGKNKKACDMFIKQQGSHYCTQQSLSQCSHIVACTCSLGTVRLIVSLLSVMRFILPSFLLVGFSTCLFSAGGTDVLCHF